MTIAELLKRSLMEHVRANGLRRQRNPVEAREALVSARSLRLQALALDPERTDPAWAQETITHPKPRDAHPAYSPTFPLKHDVLMAFYQEQLGDPE